MKSLRARVFFLLYAVATSWGQVLPPNDAGVSIAIRN